jgi:hypothetical protein
MEILRNVAAYLGSFIFTSLSEQPTVENPSPPARFTRFSELPAELRVKIWKFALKPRMIGLHHHRVDISYCHKNEAWHGYAPDEPLKSNLTAEEISRLPTYRPLTEEESGQGPHVPYPGQISPRQHPPAHFVITACDKGSPLCNCNRKAPYRPQHSGLAPPLPGVLVACHESRNATMSAYKRVMEDEYDSRGLPFIPAISGLVKLPYTEAPMTGAIINPAIDILSFTVNIAQSSAGVRELKSLTTVVAQQVPDITRVVLRGQIFMRPANWWGSQRFQYWKSFGKTGSWVPAVRLLKFNKLKEVIFYYPKEKTKREMLPDEWKARTQAQWDSELLKVESRWPESWKGIPPTFRCVTDLESI